MNELLTCDPKYKNPIDIWKSRLGISDWSIGTELIFPDQIIYDGESYFIGIETNHKDKIAKIYHDINLDDESICHELLHVKYPEELFKEFNYEEYEEYICICTNNLIKWWIG